MVASFPIKDVETIKQIKKLYAAKNDYSGLLLFDLSINTGANLKDLLELNVGDIKDKIYFSLDGKKSVLLNNQILELVKKVIARRSLDSPLFVGLKGHRLDRNIVFCRFKDICRELALSEHITIASWRKTFGYHHYRKYRDLSFLQWYFNQYGVDVTMQYIGVEENMNLRCREGICL